MITHRRGDVMRIDFSISVFPRKLEEKYEMSKMDLRGRETTSLFTIGYQCKGKASQTLLNSPSIHDVLYSKCLSRLHSLSGPADK